MNIKYSIWLFLQSRNMHLIDAIRYSEGRQLEGQNEAKRGVSGVVE